MKVAVSLKSVAALSLPSSASPAVPLNRPTLARSKWLTTRRGFSFTLRLFGCVGNPGADTLLDGNVRDRHSRRPGSPLPSWLPRAGIKLRPSQCSKSHPAASAPRRTYSSPLVPISSSLAAPSASLALPVQHWGFSGPRQCGSTPATANRAGDAGQGGKVRQSTWLAFSSPYLLKFVLCLISSARRFEIIGVSFLPLFIYPNLSCFFANGASSYLPRFSSCDTSNGESSVPPRQRSVNWW